MSVAGFVSTAVAITSRASKVRFITVKTMDKVSFLFVSRNGCYDGEGYGGGSGCGGGVS